ncbi:hypothetical protein PMI01_02948 [Caulobacter sp. AP07]|nr:hypothetical protein PMI01_02948 [Caulobacter sp. AP07]
MAAQRPGPNRARAASPAFAWLRSGRPTGSVRRSSGATTSGARPPTRKIVRQSARAMGVRATSPARAPPSGMPQAISATMVALRAGLARSEARAISIGMAPPRPRPVRNRTASSRLRSPVAAVARENRPNAATEVTSTGRRPMRSAIAPPRLAPNISPIRLALNAHPAWPGVSPRAGSMRGAATPIDWMSNPSIIAASRQTTQAGQVGRRVATLVSVMARPRWFAWLATIVQAPRKRRGGASPVRTCRRCRGGPCVWVAPTSRPDTPSRGPGPRPHSASPEPRAARGDSAAPGQCARRTARGGC